MKQLTMFTLFAILASACTAGVPEDGESIEGLSDEAYASCNSQSGVKPTKASLAVAAAMELKRWDPLKDFTRVRDQWTVEYVQLSNDGNSRCSAMGSNCANVKALLGLQYTDVNQVISQQIFNPTSYRQDLLSGFQRQADRIADLQRNSPSSIPGAHKLAKVGGPTNLGTGACGPHWVFKPTTESGGAFPNPQNLANNLYFFGHPTNAYIAFTVISGTGNVAIDPIDGDNSTPVTVSGSCPTYELDRVYDPTAAKNGTCCVTVGGKNGALRPVPRATGYYGCQGGATPTR